MTRRQFIEELELALQGEVSVLVIRENINYYDGYIREQLASGKTEEEVMLLLGDPRMIARTIIDTNGGDGDYNEFNDVRWEQTTQSQTDSFSNYYDEENSGESYLSGTEKSKIYRLSELKWYHKLLLALLAIGVMVIIGMVIIGIVQLALWLAIPVLIILGISYFIRSIMKR